MEVIKDNSHIVKCNHCESIIRFNNEDISHETRKVNIGLWHYVTYGRYTIKCPICNEVICVTSKVKK